MDRNSPLHLKQQMPWASLDVVSGDAGIQLVSVSFSIQLFQRHRLPNLLCCKPSCTSSLAEWILYYTFPAPHATLPCYTVWSGPLWLQRVGREIILGTNHFSQLDISSWACCQSNASPVVSSLPFFFCWKGFLWLWTLAPGAFRDNTIKPIYLTDTQGYHQEARL